jgi:hypothetical protein
VDFTLQFDPKSKFVFLFELIADQAKKDLRFVQKIGLLEIRLLFPYFQDLLGLFIGMTGSLRKSTFAAVPAT